MEAYCVCSLDSCSVKIPFCFNFFFNFVKLYKILDINIRHLVTKRSVVPSLFIGLKMMIKHVQGTLFK